MNQLEKWIKTNVADPKDWHEGNELPSIKHFVPPLFETYRFLYHPYYVAAGKLYTHRQRTERARRYTLAQTIRALSDIYNIHSSAFQPNTKHIEPDFTEIIQRHHPSLNEAEISKRVNEEYWKAVRITSNSPEPEMRPIKWSDLYQIYNIPFDEYATWQTISQKGKNAHRLTQKMPTMDYIDASIISEIVNPLIQLGITHVDINSITSDMNWGNTPNIAHTQSENISVQKLTTLENISMISCPNREWIMLNPYDTCRTIIAGSSDFIHHILDNTELEASKPLSAETPLYKPEKA